MKTIALALSFVFLGSAGNAQSPETDNFGDELTISRPGENRVDILLQLSSQNANIRPDSATFFAEQALSLAREIDFLEGEARALGILSYINRVLGDYPESFRLATRGLQIAKENNFIEGITLCLYGIGAVYSEGLNDHPKAIDYFKQAKEWERSASGVWNNVEVSLLLNGNIGISYLRINALDSAAFYFEKILPDSNAYMYPIMLLFYGELQFELGNHQAALDYSLKAIQSLLIRDDHRSLADAYLFRALYFRDMEQTDSCLYYAQRSLSEAESISYQHFVLKAATLLAETYEANNDPEALHYYKMAKLANDDVYGEKKVQDLQRIITEELERQQETEKATITYRNRVRQNTLFGGLGVVLLIAFLLLRNNRQKRKANTVLQSKNRELEIETSLERVRARTMAMHRSAELADAATMMYQEFLSLGITPIACAFIIFDDEKQSGQVWIAAGGQFYPDSFELPYHSEPAQERLFAAWKRKELFRLEDLSGDALITHLSFIAQNMPVGEMLEAAGDAQPDRLAIHAAYFSKGFLGFNYPQPQPGQIDILKRFAKVFDQTYTRFLDLQKAEAQAREAQIEAALERVRSRAMAMHRSEEIPEVLNVVFEQIQQLGFSSFHTVLGIFNQDETLLEVWSKSLGEYRFPSLMVLPVTDHPHFNFWLNDRKKGIEFNSWKSSGKVLRDWDDFVFGLPEMQPIPEEVKNNYRQIKEAFFHNAYLQHGILGANGPAPLPDDQLSTLKRFAKVIDLTYTRMLDLQKAEAQAKEAQIEAALERVRSRTMAMRHSSELAEVAAVLFDQLRSLGGSQYACGLVLCEDNNPIDEQWMYVDGEILPPQYIPHEEEPVHFEMFKAWQAGAELFEETVEGDQNQAMTEFLMAQPSVRKNFEKLIERMPVISWQKLHAAYFSKGYLLIVSLEEEDSAVYTRFAKVFEQTYTRFLDLQEAELRAVEAARTASLDRVRGEIASMRSPDDLQRITPLVWRELTTLGVPFFRCGVFIMDEAGEHVHAYLSTPEGKPLAVLHLPFDGAETTRQTVEHWRKGEVYTDFWDRQQFLAWVRSMTEQGLVSEAHTYQGGDEPPESLALQFVPFAQGMLYVGSHQPLPGDQVDLLRRLADTFAVAFARYEDFTKLEEAKSQIELTLTELKATQTQLIQSEKLASLGELTAGIAHEIQNPLNFVNNFAEVSAEMLGEMKEEIQQGHTEDAVDIATDLEQNLAKIRHHGLRASSIIKSMLQHSRASTGEKELTDLNALVDECVRLSYHGMRAQDRAFQAEYKLELADNLPAASVVPQDIGRVLLNLLNNAFFAVNEKRKTEPVGTYHPLVQVSTHQSDGGVEIRIRDNGPGIPEAIREKIFQPFFTTKPTGQGTGLGLSLAYDIVTKGHGGMLEVVSVEEGPVEAAAQAGTVFLIEFPL